MAVSVQMPKQGNTVEECLLVEWKVKEGDAVKQGDILCAIETDKASFDVESTADGVVLKLLANAGDLVPVLTDIAVIGEAGEKADAPQSAAAPAKETAPAAAASPAPAQSQTAQESPAKTIAPSQPQTGEFKAVSPRARKLAEKLGVDAAAIYGSGPGGRVTSRDVQAAVDNGSAVKATPLAKEIMSATGQVPGAATGVGGLCRSVDLIERGKAARPAIADAAPEIKQYKGIRKLIGDRMHQSLQEHAQLTLNASADAGGLMALRKIYKEYAEDAGLPKISINDLICWVVAQTLPSFPDCNALFDKKAATITCHTNVNLAFAVDTPRGLMVPVVPDAHRMSLVELSRAIGQHAADCRKGSINPDFLTGGTFTISNLGGMGVESFTPVLNAPQVAILGVCAITDTAVRQADGSVGLQPRLGLSLTFDHQAVDGAPAAKLLQAIAKGIENVQATLALYGAF